MKRKINYLLLAEYLVLLCYGLCQLVGFPSRLNNLRWFKIPTFVGLLVAWRKQDVFTALASTVVQPRWILGPPEIIKAQALAKVFKGPKE